MRDKWRNIWEQQQPMGRGLREYLYNLRLTREELAGKRILDVGAGLAQFGEDLKREGIGAKVISLDPLYALPIKQRRSVVREDDAKTTKGAVIDAHAGASHPLVAGSSEGLPFRDGTFDLVVSDFGPLYYFETSDEMEKFVSEALRVLNKTGELRFYPLIQRNEERTALIRRFLETLSSRADITIEQQTGFTVIIRKKIHQQD